MAVKVTFQGRPDFVHVGTAFLFYNVLRPLFGLRALVNGLNPPTVSDPPAPEAWVKDTAYTVGQYVLDSNNNVQLCTTAGTSAGTAPTWSTLIGDETDESGGPKWQNCGPSWIWAASTAVISEQQIRDSNSNIQECIIPGTTTGTAPTWSTQFGGLTTDGTAIWMCLGPTVDMGGSSGAIDFDMTAKMLSVAYDQYTAPVRQIVTEEEGAISGTLWELAFANVARGLPNVNYNSASDPNLPTNAQTLDEIHFGGRQLVPAPAILVASPRPACINPARYVVGVIYKGAGNGDGKFGLTRTKGTEWKVNWKGQSVTYRPAGYQIGMMYEQV